MDDDLQQLFLIFLTLFHWAEHSASLNFHGTKHELAKEIQICLRSASDWGGARGEKRGTDPLTTNVEGASEIEDSGSGVYTVEGVAEMEESGPDALEGVADIDPAVPYRDLDVAASGGHHASSVPGADSEGALLPFPDNEFLCLNEHEFERKTFEPSIKTNESPAIVRALGFALRKL